MHSIRTFSCLFFISLYSLQLNAQTCLSGDCYNGVGTYLFSDNAEYTGQWLNGVRTGVGCYDWADGSFYLGNFVSGKLEGYGIYLGNDEKETTLVGLFRDGKFSEAKDFGSSGCLIGNCYDGVGIYLWTNDDLYVGEWKSGIRTGYGRFDWADGDFYTGYFKDNLLDGRGFYSKKDGTEMDGYFEKNVFIRKAETETASQAFQSTPAIATKDASYVAYDNVCSLLNEVIKSYPDDFAAVKGKINDDYLALYKWHSSVGMQGGLEAGIYSSLKDKTLASLWYNTILAYTDVKQAMDKYDELVESFSNCQAACGSMIIRTTSKANERYSTYFEPVSSGKDFKGLQVIIDLIYVDYDKSWEIELQVLNDDTF